MQVPHDLADADFVVSYELSDGENAKSFFEEYGFVVGD
jgi:hypothetical protein